MRKILYVHLASVILGFIVVQNEGFFFSGPPILEFVIAFPLGCTFYICPIAICIAAARYTGIPLFLRFFAIAIDIAFSVVQLFVWLPSVQ